MHNFAIPLWLSGDETLIWDSQLSSIKITDLLDPNNPKFHYDKHLHNSEFYYYYFVLNEELFDVYRSLIISLEFK